jgi:hypothetical protein
MFQLLLLLNQLLLHFFLFLQLFFLLLNDHLPFLLYLLKQFTLNFCFLEHFLDLRVQLIQVPDIILDVIPHHSPYNPGQKHTPSREEDIQLSIQLYQKHPAITHTLQHKGHIQCVIARVPVKSQSQVLSRQPSACCYKPDRISEINYLNISILHEHYQVMVELALLVAETIHHSACLFDQTK